MGILVRKWFTRKSIWKKLLNFMFSSWAWNQSKRTDPEYLCLCLDFHWLRHEWKNKIINRVVSHLLILPLTRIRIQVVQCHTKIHQFVFWNILKSTRDIKIYEDTVFLADKISKQKCLSTLLPQMSNYRDNSVFRGP